MLSTQHSVARRGVTLIELLIVMGVLTILATLSLRTVKGLLKDQKVTQAASLVEQYIETARLRAITNGRPVAVFLERVNATGGTTATPTLSPGNFVVNRLTIGEVFPPYSGDIADTTGELWDFGVDSTSFPTASRKSDGYADFIRFTDLSAIASGFGIAAGTPGFVSEGDAIEFEGYDGVFVIENIDHSVANEVRVQFFNPPADYNRFKAATDPHAAIPPQIPVVLQPVPPGSSPAYPSALAADLSSWHSGLDEVRFRVYRRPTKSLVGAVTLPRGVAIDLSVSGFGSNDVGIDATSPFNGNDNTLVSTSNPAAYSRIALVFNGKGNFSGVFTQSSEDAPMDFAADQVLHLMVGRAEGALPNGLVGTGTAEELAASSLYTNPEEQILSNIFDPSNVWISLNPFTGDISQSTVAAIDTSLLPAGPSATLNMDRLREAVRQARTFSRLGGTN